MDGHRGDQERGRKEGKCGESGWSANPGWKRKLDAFLEQEMVREEQKFVKQVREEQAAATPSIRQAFGSVLGGAALSSSSATPTGSHASSSASEEPADAEKEEEEQEEEEKVLTRA